MRIKGSFARVRSVGLGEAAPEPENEQEAASPEALNPQFRPSLTRYFERRISGGETEVLVQEGS